MPAWEAPRTEVGLQTVLKRIEECRRTNNEVELGNGLLALSHLVKWVRSDTDQDPFVRAHELAIEALAVFRRVADKHGQVRALVSAAALADPQTRAKFLHEAAALAEELGDERSSASVLAARARSLEASREERVKFAERALEIYRRLGEEPHQAQCLMTIAINADDTEERRDAAIEAAQLSRHRDPAEACRSLQTALTLGGAVMTLEERNAVAQEALKCALEAGVRSLETICCRRLANISAELGDADAAARYTRWQQEIEASDGLTPLERWTDDIASLKMLIALCKSQGNREMLAQLKADLRRLRAHKPTG